MPASQAIPLFDPAPASGPSPDEQGDIELLHSISVALIGEQDLDALYGVGKILAGNEQWPNWYEGNAFRAAHDKLMAPAK